ncbi:MAG: zinc ribbon domain-containing protein [Chloroflexota bacterium]
MITGLTLGSILMGIALLLIVLYYLARPFIHPEDDDVRHDREEIDALLIRKATLLRQIRELDDDMEAAKVAPELYNHTRPRIVQQAALVMKQLDEHGYAEAPAPVSTTVTASVNDQIEAAVRKLRTPQEIDAAIEAAVKETRQKEPVPTNGAIRFCPQCGRRVELDERFCAGCGHKLIQESHTAQAA